MMIRCVKDPHKKPLIKFFQVTGHCILRSQPATGRIPVPPIGSEPMGWLPKRWSHRPSGGSCHRRAQNPAATKHRPCPILLPATPVGDANILDENTFSFSTCFILNHCFLLLKWIWFHFGLCLQSCNARWTSKAIQANSTKWAWIG